MISMPPFEGYIIYLIFRFGIVKILVGSVCKGCFMRPFQGWGRGYLFPCSPEINWLVPLSPPPPQKKKKKKISKNCFLCSLLPNIFFVPQFPSNLAFVPLFPCNKCLPLFPKNLPPHVSYGSPYKSMYL